MKPRVHTRCVANRYTGPRERIIEFGSDAGGGLIAFRMTEPDKKGRPHLNVAIYALDKSVSVTVERRRK